MKSYFTKDELKCNCPNGEYFFSGILLGILNKVREQYGKPMYINSACRCLSYNTKIGGVNNSAHMKGEAIDIKCSESSDRFNMINLFLKEGINRIGIDNKNNFIHIDIDKIKPQNVIWIY